MKRIHIKKHLGIFFLVGFLAFCATAQQTSNPCDNSLSAANKEYEDGRFTQCIALLEPCVKNMAGDIRFEADRLLALCYLIQNDNEKTHESAVALLRHKPDYRDFPYFDPLEFTRLLAKYEVWAQLELGVKAGLNFNTVSPIKNYSVTGSPAEFNPGTGYQAGIVAEYFIRKHISINAELLYEGLNYSRKALDVSGWSQEFTENLNYFNIPLTGRYYFYNWKGLVFVAEFGAQVQLLNATNSNIVLSNNTTSESIQNTTEQESQRNKALFYALAGVAIKYKIGGGNLCFNARYAYGLSNVVNADKRYDNMEFIVSNQYVDSDISFNPLYFSLGYQFPIPGTYAVRLRK